ncbi:MAG TPA: divalent metal cation transporter [Bryobacteraceae bacterium]|nr:divalent metal cation transporter [Bryobacteraceae bacterium]
MLKRLRYQIAIFLSVVGPGLITANVDNDSGGILTYSQAGAKYGYLPLWTLIPITLLLIVTQEMCSRMGAVTGKGLSDLIREEFGLRTTFFMMTALVLTNFTNVIAEFAGIASSLELFHISRYISVPLCAVAVWLLVVRGTYRSVEKVFLFACSLYVTYIISAFLLKPDWREAAVYSVRPILMFDTGYITMVIAMVGTSIAPWMQFYLQSAIVEKGITPKEYKQSRVEVIVGCILTDVVAFFIIVACAAAIWAHGAKDINDAADAAVALKPFGQYAYLLFSAGLFNASFFAACILPLSTVFTVCEGLGFESGVDKRFDQAPVFYWLFTLLIVLGGGVILWPNFPLVRMILFSQVINGVVLPVVLIYMVMLINKKSLMKEWTNSTLYNAVAWVSVIIMIGLTLALASITVKQMTQASAAPPPASKPLAEVQRDNARGHAVKANVRESSGPHLAGQLGGARKLAN